MRYVKANRMTYDASLGRVEPGETYFVEDDKAERWVNAGIATLAEAPPQPPPPPPPEPESPAEEDDEEDEEHGGEDDEAETEHLRADAHALHAEGLSERGIAQRMGISRSRVHSLLQS